MGEELIQYKPVLIHKDMNGLIDLYQNPKSSKYTIPKKAAFSSEEIHFMAISSKYDVYISYMRVFNESTAVWKYIKPEGNEEFFSYILKPIHEAAIDRMRGMNEEKLDGRSLSDNEEDNESDHLEPALENCDYAYNFYTEFLIMYTNLEVFEFGHIEKIHNSESNEIGILKIDLDAMMKRINEQGKNLNQLILLVQNMSKHTSDPDLIIMQEDFIVRGVMRTLYKFCSGVNLMVKEIDYDKIHIHNLVHNFKRSLIKMLKLAKVHIDRTKELELITTKGIQTQDVMDYEGLELGIHLAKKTKGFLKSNNQSQVDADLNMFKCTETEIENLNAMFKSLYTHDFSSSKHVIKEFSRESHSYLQQEF